jgi:hypothetical protein
VRAGGTLVCGAGFRVGVVGLSLAEAAVGDEALELLELLAGTEPRLLLPDAELAELPDAELAELPELPLCGAACDDEVPADVPDCWKGAGSAGLPQATSVAIGARMGRNQEER